MADNPPGFAERLARLEERFQNSSDRAAEDRAEMKEALTGVKADVNAVREQVSAVAKSVQSAVDQIKGGRMALRLLWAAGGIAFTVIGYTTGFFKALLAAIAR